MVVAILCGLCSGCKRLGLEGATSRKAAGGGIGAGEAVVIKVSGLGEAMVALGGTRAEVAITVLHVSCRRGGGGRCGWGDGVRGWGVEEAVVADA